MMMGTSFPVRETSQIEALNVSTEVVRRANGGGYSLPLLYTPLYRLSGEFQHRLFLLIHFSFAATARSRRPPSRISRS
jgi:hypothetical protein